MSPRDEQTKLTPPAIFGVVIALLGVIFTLDNLGLADTAAVVRFWPVLPIGVGVMMLMHADTTREWVFGVAWMAVGGLLLANTLGWLAFRPRDFLPLLLVAAGIWLIMREREPAPRPGDVSHESDALHDVDDLTSPLEDVPIERPPLDQPPPIPPPPPQFQTAGETTHRKRRGCGPRRARASDWQWGDWESWGGWRGRHWRPRRGHIRMLALMSGVERRLRSETFSSAEMTAIMGACELDLRHAELQGDAHINAFALWGGIEIRVPDHWVVVNRSMALMGGVEDTTRHVDGGNRPRLFVHGFALMAGIEIKN